MRILVAEDAEAAAAALASLLELLGHEVVGPAADGARAVELARSESPDLALMDVDMPVLSGIEATERIARARQIPVVLLTAHPAADLLDRLDGLPVYGYLSKPVRVETLVPAIRIARARFAEWSGLRERLLRVRRSGDGRRTLIDRAKGVLMREKGMTEDEAYGFLRTHSQRRRKPMLHVARSVLASSVLRAKPGEA